MTAEVEPRSIPALPTELDGTPVEWSPWERAPLLTHVDPECEQCAHPGPSVLALGYAVGLKRRVLRYMAHRCPACDVMRIYKHSPNPTPPPFKTIELVEFRPPRTTGGDR